MARHQPFSLFLYPTCYGGIEDLAYPDALDYISYTFRSIQAKLVEQEHLLISDKVIEAVVVVYLGSIIVKSGE